MNRSSEQVITWMQEGKTRSIDELLQAFPGRGHAIVVMVLMLLPATPLPTGFLTHIFEIIASILLLQSLVGSKGLWLPERLKKVTVRSDVLLGMSKTLGRLIKIEKRLHITTVKITSPVADRIINLLTLICVLGAFLAPPFSGLDTLPSIGAVLLSLSLIANSTLFALVGLIIGAVGIGIEVSLSRVIFKQLLKVL